MTAKPQSICTVCSLLCPTDNPLPAGYAARNLSVCSARIQWVHRRGSTKAGPAFSMEAFDAIVGKTLQPATHPLIWIDAADVETVRAAVQLADQWRATIHVAKSVGSQNVSNVLCGDGWFGTTLADAARHSDLLVTLGNRWKQNVPLLVDRFFSDKKDLQWWSVETEGQDAFQSTRQSAYQPAHKPTGRIVWPRQQWYRQLSQLILQLRDLGREGLLDSRLPAEQDSITHDSIAHDSMEVDSIAAAIDRSASTTLVWDKSEFDSAADEMLVHQLHQLAQLRSKSARFSLLPIECDSGRETAEAALLWLTGCASTARPTREDSASDGWYNPPHWQTMSPSQWRSEYDCILAVRNTPSHRALDLIPDLLLCPTSEPATDMNHDSPSMATTIIPVGTAGVDHDAMLIRGDHGMTCFAPADRSGANFSNADSTLPAASHLLRRAASILAHEPEGRQ